MTIENGKPYTQFDNDLLAALLLINTTKRKLKIMLTMVRLTDGFHKDGNRVPLSTIMFWTRIAKGNASKPFNELIKDKMLTRDGDNISIQKDIYKWKGVIDLITSNRLSKRQLKVIGLDPKKVINSDPYKETPKEKLKRKVFSKPQDKEQMRKNKERIAGMVSDIKIMPGLKK